jgi:hypothetical protein
MTSSDMARQEAEAEDRGWASAAIRSFARDWDNTKDAIYDIWREQYDVPER